MPTWEQHQRALGKARAAGDAEAVAEIEANIAGQAAEKPAPRGGAVHRPALAKAIAANDHEAADEIAQAWMDDNEADGKWSPRKLKDDELRKRIEQASQAKDVEGTLLLLSESKRRRLKQPDAIESTINAVKEGAGAAADMVMGLPGAIASGADNFGKGVQRLASGDASLADLGGAVAENAATIAMNVPGADFVGAGAGNIVNFLEGDENDPNLREKFRAASQGLAQKNPVAGLTGELLGAAAIGNRVMAAPALELKAGERLANTARVAAGGGATEGLTALVDTGDVGEAAKRAAAGAVVSPILAGTVNKVADAVTALGGAARNVADFTLGAPRAADILGERNIPTGMKKLAQIVKMTPQELDAARVALKEARGGQNPSIAEIVDQATIQRTQRVVDTQGVVAKGAQDAAEAGELARPGRLQDVVARGGPTKTAGEVTAARETAAQDNLDALGRERRVRGQQATADTRAAVAGEIRATNAEAGKILTDAEAAADAAKDAARATKRSRIADQTAEANRVIQAQRTATERDINTINKSGQQAAEDMRAEMRNIAKAGDLPAVERATALRDEWADGAMKLMDEKPVTIPQNKLGTTLGLKPVRDIVDQLRRAADTPAEAARLDKLLSALEDGKAAVQLTVRDIDSIRQGLRAAAEANPAIKGKLGNVANAIIEAARDSSPLYKAFLTMYGDLSDAIGGQAIGAKMAGGGVGFQQQVADATGATKSGIEAGARLAVESAAANSTDDALKLARDLATEGGSKNAALVLGEDGARLADTARRGVETVDEAAALAKSRALQGKNAVAETKAQLAAKVEEAKQDLQKTIRQVGRDLKSKRGDAAARRQEGAAKIAAAKQRLSDYRAKLDEAVKGRTAAVKGRLAAEKGAVSTAAKVSSSDTATFKQAFEGAPETVKGDLGAVARGALAEDVGNSFGRSTQAAYDLQDPALGQRLSTVLGPDEAARIAKAGQLEARAGENLDQLNPAPQPKFSAPNDDMSIVGGAIAAGKAGAGFKFQVLQDILNRFQKLGMSETAAKGLSNALFDPARAEEAINVLKQIKQWDEVKRILSARLAVTQQATVGNE